MGDGPMSRPRLAIVAAAPLLLPPPLAAASPPAPTAFARLSPPAFYAAAPTEAADSPARRALLTSPAVSGCCCYLTLMASAPWAAAGAAAAPPPADTVGWGIIGLGDVTAVKSGPAFRKCDGSDLVAVMRRTPGAAAEWVRTRAGPDSSIRPYDDMDEFLSDPGLGAVYVATPPGSHLEVALRVAEAGKACYVEKPVGRSEAETRAIVEAFERRDVPLFTAYVSRSYERTDAIRKLLAEGAAGDRVMSVTYRLKGSGVARGMDADGGELPWRLDARRSGGGLIMDVGCHVIDRIDYLCGPLADVAGRAENRASPRQRVEDYVELKATIGKCPWAAVESEGAAVDCLWDFASEDGPLDELVISGPGGSLRMAAMSPSLPVEVLDSGGDVVRSLTFEAPQHAAQALIQAVTDELRGVPGRRSPSRGDNALRTSAVLDAVLGPYYGGRGDAFWERPDTWAGGNGQRI